MKIFVRLFVASLMALQVTAADNNSGYNGNNGYNGYNNGQYSSNNCNQYNNGQNDNANNENNENNNNNNNNNNNIDCEDNYYDDPNYDANYAYTSNGFLDFETCPDGVVQVTNVKILCDSPYEYSYGNGAKRNSPACDYGDKATITVYFSVSKNLGYGDNIFIDMGAYALKGTSLELLWEASAVELSTLVGHSCTDKGTYAFATTGDFEYFENDSSEFYPYVEIAFSTAADQGTNLGGVNVQCNLGKFYNAWAGTKSSKGTRVGKFILNMFTFAAVLGVIGAGAFFVHQKYRGNIEYEGTIEKINGYYNNMGWGETEADDNDGDSTDQSMHA